MVLAIRPRVFEPRGRLIDLRRIAGYWPWYSVAHPTPINSSTGTKRTPMATEASKIIYTLTDEAPFLATCAFLPIVRAFTAPADIDVAESDISVAARVLASFPEGLTEAQRVTDNLAELGKLTLLPDHQHHQAAQYQCIGGPAHRLHQGIAGQGLQASPTTRKTPRPTKKMPFARAMAKCIGSAVNPVLREGNSDRRAPRAVKELRPQEPAFDGRVEPGLAHPRLAHAPWRLLPR
jgi:isocitrate dehydrogenase